MNRRQFMAASAAAGAAARLSAAGPAEDRWIDVDEALRRGLIPCEVLDANGNVIQLPIIGYNAATGEVEYFVQHGGRFVIEGDHAAKRRARFPAPLRAVSLRKPQ